jgi:hypothetical protein
MNPQLTYHEPSTNCPAFAFLSKEIQQYLARMYRRALHCPAASSPRPLSTNRASSVQNFAQIFARVRACARIFNAGLETLFSEDLAGNYREILRNFYAGFSTI